MIKYIGAYIAEMNGVDAIIFTGGIGEHNSVCAQGMREFLLSGTEIRLRSEYRMGRGYNHFHARLQGKGCSRHY
jgi:acetate kinase